MAKSKAAKKRKVVVEATGQAHIQASFNNVIVTLTNKNGEVISWSSAGKMGFRGSKRIHLMLHKLLHKMLQLKHWKLVLEELRFM